MPRVYLVLAALLLPLGLLDACGGDDEPEPATGPGLPSQAELASYFSAIASGDAGKLAKARSEVAAKGSPAQAYAAYVADSSAAAAAAGKPNEPVEVEAVNGGFKACAAPDRCVTWADLEGRKGKLVDFTVSGTALSDSLVDLTGQRPITAAGLYVVRPGYAYRLPQSGTLNVVVTVTARSAALSPKPGTYIEADQILKGAKAASPATIAAGSRSPVVLSFPHAQDAQLDGQVTFGLGIGGGGSESIGFGLADPTP
jgi:hypothetical protein